MYTIIYYTIKYYKIKYYTINTMVFILHKWYTIKYYKIKISCNNLLFPITNCASIATVFI